MSDAHIYGPTSAVNLSKSLNLPSNKVHTLNENNSIKISNFKITPLKAIHPAHIFGLTFASGDIQTLPKNPNFFDYKSGDNFSFLIEHPQMNILFHPSSQISEGLLNRKTSILTKKKIDIIIIGMANIPSQKRILKLIDLLNPKIIIPVHHDSLFSPISAKSVEESFFSGLDDFKEKNKVEILEVNYKEKTNLSSIVKGITLK